MIISNVTLGKNVNIDTTADFNNVDIGDNVKISKYSSVFGAPTHQTIIGNDTKIRSGCFLNGFDSFLEIGERCGISRHVQILTGSGPSSKKMGKAFPVLRGPVKIGNDCWIGASVIILPNVTLGEFCIVAGNSFVNKSFPAFSIIGGSPAKLIRTFTEEEKRKVQAED
jgi:acetyltransferase-like isoleucine patch superfamily enzyme